MAEELGELLARLDNGDSILVTVGDASYEGEVDDEKRWECELKDGTMGSGSVSVYLDHEDETIDRKGTSAKRLRVTAREVAPLPGKPRRRQSVTLSTMGISN